MKYYHTNQAPYWDQPLELYVRDVNFFHFNWHTGFELTILLKGRISFYIDGVRHIMQEDDVFLINPNCGHAIIAEDKESVALSLHFPAEYISIPVPELKKITIDCASTPETRSELRFARLRYCAAQMMLAAVQNVPSSSFLMQGSFLMLLGRMLSEFPIIPESKHDSPRGRSNLKTIKNVTRWIEKNYDKRLTLETAAKVARYSRTYFSSFFRRNVGIQFYDYLMRVRFRHALYLLNNTSKSLTEIAADCGFADLKTFSAYYKKMFHEPPSARRNSMSINTFTPVRENERIYIDTSVQDIGEKLQAYIKLELPHPQYSLEDTPLKGFIDQFDSLRRQMNELSETVRSSFPS